MSLDPGPPPPFDIVDDRYPEIVPQEWWGAVRGRCFEIDGGVPPNVLEATVYAPHGPTTIEGDEVESPTYPGARPIVVVLHGHSVDESHQRWAAAALAGHGYITATFTAAPMSAQAYDTRLLIDWLCSEANPYLALTDTTRIGAIGHSAGAGAVQNLQSPTYSWPDPRIDAVVAWDHLRRWHFGGDPGSPGPLCYGNTGTDPYAPTKPALGVSSDGPCDGRPAHTPTDLKLCGYRWWLRHGIDTASFTVRGTVHGSFDSDVDDETSKQRIFWITKTWLDRYVAGDPGALDAFDADDWGGEPRSDVLSEDFSAAVNGRYLTLPPAGPLTIGGIPVVVDGGLAT